jgi:lipoate-protein ligase A
VEEFTDFLFGEICQGYPEFKVYELTPEDMEAIEKLSIEKYQIWDWIFGYSPKYRFTNKLETEIGEIQIRLLVEKGLLVEVLISGAIQKEFSKKIEEALIGCRHEYEAVKRILAKLNSDKLLSEDLRFGLF